MNTKQTEIMQIKQEVSSTRKMKSVKTAELNKKTQDH